MNYTEVHVHKLEALEGNDSNLMKYKRIIGSNCQSLVEEPLGQFGVVCESILKADIQQRQMTSTPQQQHLSSFNRHHF